MVTVVIAECLGTITANPTFEFLRKSVYAAYATLVIVTLLVAKKSAAGSANNGQCEKLAKTTIQLMDFVFRSSLRLMPLRV